MKLLEQKEQVRATYRSTYKLQKAKFIFEKFGKGADFNKIQWEKVDILDQFQLEEAFGSVQWVYHCAAIVSFYPKDIHKMMKINIEGTSNVVNLCLEKQIKKLCYVSSVSTIGEYFDKRCSDEKAIWNKSSLSSNYSISKFYAENEVWRASEEGLDVVIVNPATILGYGDWNEGSSAIFKRVYNGLKFYPGGANSFVGVNDVVDAMLLLMQSKIVNQRYILSAESISFKELLQKIAFAFNMEAPNVKASKIIAKMLLLMDSFRSSILGGTPLLTKESLIVSYKNACYISEKFKKEFQFEFKSLDEVIEKAAAFYKAN